MDCGTSNRKPYGRCLTLARGAAENYGATEALFTRSHISAAGFTLRRWLVVFEALLRENMDEERSAELDRLLEQSEEDALETDEKHELMLRWGGEAEVV